MGARPAAEAGLDVGGRGGTGRGDLRAADVSTWALTEEQDDAGQHDDQGAQADARAPRTPGSSPWQAGTVLAAAAHRHVQGLLALLGRLP